MVKQMRVFECAECHEVTELEEDSNFPRKYCLKCSAKKKAEFSQGSTEVKTTPANVVKAPVKTEDVKKENGEYQSTVYNRTVAPNSYEVGTAGNRFKLYFETPQELKDKMQELRDAGLMDMPLSDVVGEIQ